MTNPLKPYSQACENNKGPILEVLSRYADDLGHVLEIGSGTGQHAAFFARQLTQLQWQTSDLREHHAGIRLWVEQAGLGNLAQPLDLDVMRKPWPVDRTDTVFSANTVHIMGWPAVECLVEGVGRVLRGGGLFFLYGPFNYGGRYTSASNARFDELLRSRNPESAIRDFEAIDELATKAGLLPIEDCEMPANNRLLVWRRVQ